MKRWVLGGVLALAAPVLAAPRRPAAPPPKQGESAAAALQRGLERLEAGQPEEAARLLRLAVARDPKSAEARSALAQALQRLEQYPAAIAEAEAAVRLAPGKADYRLLLGDLRVLHD